MRKLLLLLILVIFLTGCNLFRYTIIGGNGEVSDFIYSDISENPYRLVIDNLETDQKNIKINFLDGEKSEVVIKVDDNLMETITVSTDDDEIKIKGKKNSRYRQTEFEINFYNIQFDEIIINGYFELDGDYNQFSQDLKLKTKGAITGKINALKITNIIKAEFIGFVDMEIYNISADKMDLNLKGTHNIELKGVSDRFDLQGEGVVNINAKYFQTKTTYIHLSGVMNCTVHSIDALDVIAEGVGSITYYGEPTIAKSFGGTINFKQG